MGVGWVGERGLKHQGKRHVSNQAGDGHKRETDELDDYLGGTTSNFNSHWIIQLHVNSETMKLLEESLGNTLMVLGLAKIS